MSFQNIFTTILKEHISLIKPRISKQGSLFFNIIGISLLRRDASVDGMKTGYTRSAGYCLVATAQRDGTRLIAVITGAKSDDDRNNAASALLNYGFRFFEERMVIESGKGYGQAQVWKGKSRHCSNGCKRSD